MRRIDGTPSKKSPYCDPTSQYHPQVFFNNSHKKIPTFFWSSQTTDKFDLSFFIELKVNFVFFFLSLYSENSLLYLYEHQDFQHMYATNSFF